MLFYLETSPKSVVVPYSSGTLSSMNRQKKKGERERGRAKGKQREKERDRERKRERKHKDGLADR